MKQCFNKKALFNFIVVNYKKNKSEHYLLAFITMKFNSYLLQKVLLLQEQTLKLKGKIHNHVF